MITWVHFDPQLLKMNSGTSHVCIRKEWFARRTNKGPWLMLEPVTKNNLPTTRELLICAFTAPQ